VSVPASNDTKAAQIAHLLAANPEGLTSAEICDDLGISRASFGVHLHKLRTRYVWVSRSDPDMPPRRVVVICGDHSTDYRYRTNADDRTVLADWGRNRMNSIRGQLDTLHISLEQYVTDVADGMSVWTTQDMESLFRSTMRQVAYLRDELKDRIERNDALLAAGSADSES
jgi:DNA-binding transcriptional ArsR family regulator